MSQTSDVKVTPYGTEGPIGAAPVGATVQLWVGEVALVSAGTGATAGYLKNAATAASTDIVVGVVADYAGGTGVDTGQGVVGGATDGAVWASVLGGAVMMQSGTGSDLLTAGNNYKSVYYVGENAQGPIVSPSSSGATRPLVGTQLPQDPGFNGGATPGANYWPIKFSNSYGS